jgi:transposase-like protein
MNNPNRPSPPARRHDETFRRHAVELSLRGDRSVTQIAVELGISTWSLYQWRKLYGPSVRGTGPLPQTIEEKDKEIGQLRAELLRMRERETILKKSLGILSETPESGMPRSKR